jgi:hypothetical protein
VGQIGVAGRPGLPWELRETAEQIEFSGADGGFCCPWSSGEQDRAAEVDWGGGHNSGRPGLSPKLTRSRAALVEVSEGGGGC